MVDRAGGNLFEAQNAYLRSLDQLYQQRVRPIEEWLEQQAPRSQQEIEQDVRRWLTTYVIPLYEGARECADLDGALQAEAKRNPKTPLHAILQEIGVQTRRLENSLEKIDVREGRRHDPKVDGVRVIGVENRGEREGTILEVRQRGYTWNGKTLREAQVVVQSAAQAPGRETGPPTTSTQQEAEDNGWGKEAEDDGQDNGGGAGKQLQVKQDSTQGQGEGRSHDTESQAAGGAESYSGPRKVQQI
jgi:molecular chaperone GrpE (heat shock protein)